ncbi:MAG: hypothetical protein ABGY71_15915 [bacterium]|nr:hypothetical protein [Planctomycetota bacterium]HIL50651.1 hypothetical protein [Planctomycetota bacterium]
MNRLLPPALLLGALFAVQLLAAPTVLAPSSTQDKAKAPMLEPFVGDLAAARKASAEQHLPLLIHILLEGEPQNDEYRDGLLPDPAVVAHSVRMLVLIANNGDHPQRTIRQREGDKLVERSVCSAYPWYERCSDHRMGWDDAYAAFADEDGAMRCPQTVIELPTGKISWHFNTGNLPSAAEVITEIKKARKQAGPGLTRDELRRVKSLARSAQRATDGKLWGNAWREWSEVHGLIAKGQYGQQAKAALERIETAMGLELEALKAKLIPGTAAAAYAELHNLAREWATCPAEREVLLMLKRAEKNKAIKAEVARMKVEVQAEDVWLEAQELLRQGKERAGMKLMQKLLRRKFRETPAADRVRAKYPDLAKR